MCVYLDVSAKCTFFKQDLEVDCCGITKGFDSTHDRINEPGYTGIRTVPAFIVLVHNKESREHQNDL